MGEKKKIIYYSYALLANHGGKLHSEAFVSEVRKNEDFKILALPKKGNRIKSESSSNMLRDKLKRNSLFQVLFFYRRNRSSWNYIKKIIHTNNPDFLHIRIDSNFLIIKKIRKTFPKLLVSLEINSSPFDENFSNIFFKTFFKKLERQSYSAANANFFVSQNLRSRILKKVNQNRDFVVHNGVHENLYSNAIVKKFLHDPIRIVYMGTLDFHKNLNVLLEALVLVKNRVNNRLKLHIIGDGPMKNNLKDLSSNLNIEDLVVFEGWIAHEYIPDTLSTMDIAIHHSANQYMSPLKIFEYMAAGLPVIGPQTEAVMEIFSSEEIVLVKCDSEDLADKMVGLIENENKRLSIGECGRKKVMNNYTWKANANFILDKISFIKESN